LVSASTLELNAQRKWFAVAFAALILPISLLTTLKLTGIILEPQQPETTTLEHVTWRMERPLGDMEFDEKINVNYLFDDMLSMDVNVFIHVFSEAWGFLDVDNLIFSLSLNLTSTQKHVSSIKITYEPITFNSTLFIGRNDCEIEKLNVTIKEMRNTGEYEDRAYVAFNVLNVPCYLKTQCYWAFWNDNTKNYEHMLQIILEVVYFNGTVYKKAVVPIVLWMGPDAGETFETALTITPGVSLGSLHWQLDPTDFYKVMLMEGKIINVSLTPTKLCSDCDLYIFDPNGQLRASSCTPGDPVSCLPLTEHITFTADSTGYWYIKIQKSSSVLQNPYLLNITTSP